MLGRLEITVDECIRQYLLLMEEVFTGCTWWNYAWDGQFYDAGWKTLSSTLSRRS
jgi:hypothetical protein